MSSADMYFFVEIPDFNTYSEEVKSLLNFFLKDSALFLEGNYDASDNWVEMYGNIQTLYRTLYNSYLYEDYTHTSLNIAYAPTLPNPYPVGVLSTYDDESGLPKIVSTLIAQTSMLQICDYYNENNSYTAKVFDSGVPPLNIPVTITPKIGSTINTDPSYKPTGISASNKVLPVKISSSNGTFESKYQLRTSSFRIWCGSSHNPTHYDVFYKIGICPLEKKINLNNWTNSVDGRSLETLISLLKTTETGGSWSGGRKLGIYIESISEPAFIEINFSYINEYDTITAESRFVQEHGIKSEVFDILPQRMILPLVMESNYSNYIEAYVYIELFNNDGSVFSVDPDSFTCVTIQISEDGENYEDANYYNNNLAYLLLTDQNMEGGFIGTKNY